MKEHEHIYPKMLWVFFAVFFIGVFICVFQSKPVIMGDGAEYILHTAAIQNHGSLDIRPEDVKRASEEFYGLESILQSMYDTRHGFHETAEGEVFANHFGAYSALVIPAKTILILLDIHPIYAFFITNAILWTMAILAVIVLLKTDWKKKFWISMLLMFNPAIFYLDWTHTEIYIFAFTIIGLVFFYNKQYRRAIFFVSVAAMQNIAILPYAMIIGIDYIINFYHDKMEKWTFKNSLSFIRSYWKEILPYGCFYIPAAIPLMVTFIHFGTLNVVADVAREKEFLMEKAFAYAFDLNIGILPFEPIIILMFLIMLIVGLKTNRKESLLNLIGVGGIFYIISNQRQINSGMECIMRYNVWIIPIMIFFVAMHWEVCVGRFKASYMAVFFGIETTYTICILGYLLLGNGAYNYGQFAPWTKKILAVAPQLYNPVHGIFYSRCSGGERYYSSYPVGYYDEDGYVKKIILNQQSEADFLQNWILYDDSGNELDKNVYVEKSNREKKFRYINFQEKVRMERWFDNAEVTEWPDGETPVKGMYAKEGDKCWATKESTIVLQNPNVKDWGMELVIMPTYMVKHYTGKEFELDIYVNNKLIRTVSDWNYDVLNKIYISPQELDISEDDVYHIELLANSSCTPEPSRDLRDFSYMFQYIGEARLPENYDIKQQTQNTGVTQGFYQTEGDKCWVRQNSSALLKNAKIEEAGMEIVVMPTNMVREYTKKEFVLDIYINGKLIRTVNQWEYDAFNTIYMEAASLKGLASDDIYHIALQANSSCTPNPDEDLREFSYLVKYIGASKANLK